MKNIQLLVLFFVLISSIAGQTPLVPLKGCPDPQILAGALQALQNTDWSKLSIEDAKNIWPTGLKTSETTPIYVSLLHLGRVVKGEIDCSEIFNFQGSQREKQARMLPLESITIKYATHTRNEIVAVQRSLISGFDLRQASEEIFGDMKDISWNTKVVQNQSCELQIRQNLVGTTWRLWFRLSCFPPFQLPASN